MLKALILAAILSFAGFVAQAQSVAGGIDEAYLAKDDGEGKAGDQVTEFRTTDIPIYCVILLESALKTVVKMNFVAVSVAGVKTETRVVSASYTTKGGQNRVNFTGRPEGRWTPGKYRVDIFLDGKIAKNLDFEIKGTPTSLTAGQQFQPPAEAKPKPFRKPGKN